MKILHLSKLPNNFKFNNKGFTLVELLIVIAIIGILASLISVNFVGIRQRARDSQRKSDVRQIQSALELYRTDNGAYPSGFQNYSITNTASCSPASPVSFILGSVTYMTKVPCDPLAVYNGGNYFYSSNGTTYTVTACLENANDGDQNATNTPPANGSGCTGKYYTVANP